MTETGTAVNALAERLGVTGLVDVDPHQGRLFRGVRDGIPARLKVFDDERAYTNEVESLTILNGRGAPVPHLLAAVHTEEGEFAAVTEWWDGRCLKDVGVPRGPAARGVLRQAGEAIGRVHAAVTEADLAAATFWMRHGYESWQEVGWRDFIDRRLGKWLAQVQLTDEEERAGMGRCLEMVAERTSRVPEPTRWTLLHCDLSYRNLLAADDGSVMGVIDFEAASVGDPVYDLAKLPWVDLTEEDGDLLEAFLEGWATAWGAPADRALLDTYIAIQAVAAVSWVDKKGDDAPLHQDFRDRAKGTLLAACARLEG